MSKKATILVVDDEPVMVRLLRASLDGAGFRVLSASDGEEAVALTAREQPDLLILDIMLPKMDGFAVCRAVREFSRVPILMLTARTTEVDLIQGFEAGADDYLTKPFSAGELMVRVQALLRRSKWPEQILQQRNFRAGPIEIDFALHRVTVARQPVKLTPTEYRLLVYLATNANRVISHRELLRAVWGPEYGDEAEYLRVYTRYLRQKLEPDPANPRYLLTQAGAGYMLFQPEEDQ